MKLVLKSLCFLCVLCGASSSFSLDREAFSITNYDLQLQIEPEQHRLGARGKVTLRNDTATPQKIAVLQVSSSLDWRLIRAGDKTLQFVTQPLTSDIDHTGSLSEAIVTLPQEVAPRATIDLDVAYEGIIVQDATRLTRIGTPEDVAKKSDWDRIDVGFAALRGAGYVAWYPIATEVANLSEGDDLNEVVSRWKRREAGSSMRLQGDISASNEATDAEVLFSGMNCAADDSQGAKRPRSAADCTSPRSRRDLPTLLIADYQRVNRSSIEVRYLAGHEAAATQVADATESTLSTISDWFGPIEQRAQTADLPDTGDVAFESGSLLLIPLSSANLNSAGLAAAHQLTHASFLSFRPWIEEGLAHFAQALYVERQNGRQAALDYMGMHRSALTTVEAPDATAGDESKRSLVNTVNEERYRSKAMCVWWMLRDMIGDAALKKAIATYKPEEDNDPSYMQRLIAAQTQRDLGWFFDDWVYRDRGLPEFKVESAYSSRIPTKGFMLTITLDNLGTAGAEVPVNIKFNGGEMTKRIEVRAKSKATVRVETPAVPQEIRVNDGSVPESETRNNIFKIEAPKN